MPSPLARFLLGRSARRAAVTPRRVAPRLQVDPLESRLAPANLRNAALQLVDASNTPSAIVVNGVSTFTTVTGGMVRVRATWLTDDMSDQDKYAVRVALNGFDLTTVDIQGTGGQSVAKFLDFQGWYAKPGLNTLTVTLDSANQIVETNDKDNTATFSFTPVGPNTPLIDAGTSKPTTLPSKLINPITGKAFSEWGISQYADIDPRGGTAQDLKGNQITGDGAVGTGVSIANYTRADAGVPVVAAAAGTVISVGDGNYDRQVATGKGGVNRVVVRLDDASTDNWQITYDHLLQNTVTVKVGDTIEAGQLLGLVGGSGDTTNARLRYEVRYKGLPIEPNFAAGEYYFDAPPYQGDLTGTVLDAGLTPADPAADLAERPPEASVFVATKQDVYFWAKDTVAKGSDAVQVKWFLPNDKVQQTDTIAVTATAPLTATAKLPAASVTTAGVWRAAMYVNGTEVTSKSFTVTTGTGQSVIRISLDAGDKNYVVDGRTTPVDFADVAVGAAPPTVALNIANLGAAALTLSNFSFPAGFAVSGTAPTSVAAGATAKLTIQMPSAGVGQKFGAFTFTTNDPAHPTFDFVLRGNVTGTATVGAPVVGLSGPPAVAYRAGGTPVLITPDATVTDPDSPSFVGGELRVEFARVPVAGDKLFVRNQGGAKGEVTVANPDVSYNDQTGTTKVIGTITGGTGGTPLVVAFNGFATLEAVQAVARNLTFENAAAGLTSVERTYRVSVVDNTGIRSTLVNRTVLPTIPPDIVRLGPVTPSLRTTPVNTVDVVFLNTFDPTTFTTADLKLTKASDPTGTNLITPAVTITNVSGTTYRIGNLSAVDAADDTYTLTVNAATVRTFGGVQGQGSESVTWTTDSTAPTVTINQAAAQPDPTADVPVLYTVVFSEPVTGFGKDDVILSGTAGASGIEVVPSGDGKTYTVRVLTANASGTVVATVVAGAATDAAGNLSRASTSTDNVVTFQTIPTNLPPTITPITDQTVPFNGNTGPLTFTVGDDTSLPANLIVRATSDDPVLIPSTGLVLFGSGADRSIVVAPTAGRSGTATVTLTVEDETGLQTTTSFRVTVAEPGQNTPPTISNVADRPPVLTGTVIGPISFTVNDAETAAADLVVTASSSNAALFPAANVVVGGTGATRTVTLTPAAGITGTATITLTVFDASGGSATDTFTVTVTATAPNTAPTISAVANPATVTPGTTVGPINFTVGDAETLPGALTVRAASSNPALIPNTNIGLGGTGDARTVTLFPLAGQTGTTTITLTVTDANGLTATTSFVVTVANVLVQRPTQLVGYPGMVVGADTGGGPTVTRYDSTGAVAAAYTADAAFAGGVRTASADFNGDGVPDFLIGSGPGTSAQLRILDGVTLSVLFENAPFELTFTGGIYVAAGDVTGDGIPDVVVTPDLGGGPRVRVFNGKTFAQVADFFGIDDPNFRGGARAAVGDINGDGVGDLVVAAGYQGGPRVAGYDGAALTAGRFTRVFADFFTFEPSLRNGAYVAVGDVNGDGYADLVAGGGPSGGPRVTAFSGKSLLTNQRSVVANFFAGDPNNRGGVRLAVKDLDGDAKADIVTGSGTGAGSRVIGYYGKNITPAGTPPVAVDFDAYPGFTGGVFVG